MNANAVCRALTDVSSLSRNLIKRRRIERNATIWHREIKERKAYFPGRGGFPIQAQLPRLVLL